MWELCSLPSAPRPHHPGRCVYRVDFFGMYLWQSVALFCQGHGARLFPRFTVLKKKKKREKTHTLFARPSAALLATVPLAPGPWALLLRARLCPAASQHLPVQAGLAAHVGSPPLPPPFTTPPALLFGSFLGESMAVYFQKRRGGGKLAPKGPLPSSRGGDKARGSLCLAGDMLIGFPS